MRNRTVGFAIVGLTLMLLALVGALTLFGGSTQAAAPTGGAGDMGASGASVDKAQNATDAPNVSTWVDIAPFPTITADFTPGPQSMKLKRAGAAAYTNGRLYVLGGRHGADGQDINMRNVFEYNPGTNAWVQKSALLDSSSPGERATANMAVAMLTDPNGARIYAIGGNDINSNPSAVVRIYNPTSDTVTTLTAADNWPASPARVPGGYAVHNNKLYIFGGFSGLGAGAVYANTWVFDPMGAVGAKWTQLTSNLSLARGYIAGAMLDGKIYAIGGDTWNAGTHQLIPQTLVERYDPANPGLGWVPVASLPTARGDMSAWAYDTGTGYEISGKVVIAGGVYPIPDNTSYMYDPLSNSWSGFPSLNHATRNYAAAQLNGILYAFGGYDYTNNIPDGANFNQKYDATGPTATPSNTPQFSPTSTNTPFSTDYSVCVGSGVIDPGTSLIPGSQCDDCIVTINLPFAYTLYNQGFSSVEIASNGSLGFIQVDANPAASCLPNPTANYSIFGYWDDLTTTGAGNGIFTSTVGSAPNRIFNIEWRGNRTRTGTGVVNYEIRLIEGQTYFEIIYGTVAGGGNTATVGVQKDIGSLFTQYRCVGQAPNLSNGQKLTFTLSAGVCPTNTPTFTPTLSPTRTPTVTGTLPTSTNTPLATDTPTGTLPPTHTRTRTITPTRTITLSPTITNTTIPVPPCGPGADYVITQSSGAIVPGTTDTGNHGDDTVTNVALPFAYSLYGQPFNSANVSSNGNLQFVSTSSAFTNSCLPAAAINMAIFPHWDDLRTDAQSGCATYPGGLCGIFTSVSGTAPNRIFNIEWRTVYFGAVSALANFEVRLYEGQDKFDLVFGQVDQTGTGATIGVQNGIGPQHTQFSCNTGSLSTGLVLTFASPPCLTGTPTHTSTSTPIPPTATLTHTNTSTATNTPTNTPTNVPTNTPTNTPLSGSLLVGHVTWQQIPQPDARSQQPVTLTLKLGATEVNYPVQNTDSSGFFTVSVNSLPAGTYNWRVKGPKWLANTGSVSLPGSGTTQQEMGLMLAGDCNDSNIVNIVDFSILQATFGKSSGDPGYDARADLNGDNVVNVADFNLLKINFGTAGAPPIGPQQGK